MRPKTDKLLKIKGVKDVLPDEAYFWQQLEQVARSVFERYQFGEIRIPTFEKTEVFVRSIGENSDIVEKEMYTLKDRGGDSLTLRPEGTAPVVRAYVEEKLFNDPSVNRLYYMGPMFRAERPQAGRQRQFHQIGAEVFGSNDPSIDAELILMLFDFFYTLRIEGLELRLNSLGCPNCRPGYREKLLGFLRKHIDELCDDCNRRVEKNPFRVLDCKSINCQKATEKAPTIDNNRCSPCEQHFTQTISLLEGSKIPINLDPKLVRGLDYYSNTAFEVKSASLGAQDAIAGGGRYNGLVEQFGGPSTPAIGFALGVERLLTLLDKTKFVEKKPDAYLISLESRCEDTIFNLTKTLREQKLSVERGIEHGSLKSQMRKANRSGAKFAVIVGLEELSSSMAIVKNMEDGEQKTVLLDEVSRIIGQ
ncbi:MAG TPA: histidine--tRNA ligase [Nitrospinota bacterium]|nr:histidine--tRNA ligase [Nitrospinota bacterium]|tara:strand:- start:24435 stop:25694 length:1260 start_codon:yes stop_codon:yes gene_type:complete